jgi:hypothetical protein
LMSLDSGLSTQMKNRSDFWNATLCACLPQIEGRNDQIYDDVLKNLVGSWLHVQNCSIAQHKCVTELLNH